MSLAGAVVEHVLARGARQDELLHALTEFDAEPDLLCVANGVLNLRTGELSPHHPKYLITKMVVQHF